MASVGHPTNWRYNLIVLPNRYLNHFKINDKRVLIYKRGISLIQARFRGNTPPRGEEGVKIPCGWGVDGVENPTVIEVIYGSCILRVE
jgi:hypothetical protein